MVRRVTMWKMGLGAVLAALLLGVVGGLMFLQHLVDQASPGADDRAGDARLIVSPSPGIEWYNGTFPAERLTALGILDEAYLAQNLQFTTHDRGEGPRVVEINGKTADPAKGDGWTFWIARQGLWVYGGDSGPATRVLQAGDTILWVYGPAPERPQDGPAGYAGAFTGS